VRLTPGVRGDIYLHCTLRSLTSWSRGIQPVRDSGANAPISLSAGVCPRICHCGDSSCTVGVWCCVVYACPGDQIENGVLHVARGCISPTHPRATERHAIRRFLSSCAESCLLLQVSWNGSEVAAEPEANTSLNANGSHHHHPVDEDWVKGLYDMEGME